MKTRISFLLVVFLLGFGSAHASDTRLTLGTGFEFGGDNLLGDGWVTSTGESATMGAGDGFYFNGGMIVALNEEKTLDGSLTLGWKFTGKQTTDGDTATLSRFPIEAMLTYRAERHRLGAGLAYHAGIESSGTGLLSYLDLSMESNLGFILSYDYSFGSSPNPKIAFGAKLTSITYEVKEYNDTVDAGSFGLYLIGRF